MFAKILALGALAFAVLASPSRNGMSWNELAGADKAIFHREIDSIQSKSLETYVLIAELKELLGQDEILDAVYTNYVAQYKQDPPRAVDPTSKASFKNTLISIITHNLEAQKGEFEWTEGVNQFTDMSSEEYSKYLTLTISPSEFLSKSGIPQLPDFKADPTVPPPASIDWKERGKVTSVKNQENCGSCYAFAGIGTLESLYLIKNGETFDLSEQQVVDCSRTQEYGNNGCDGGTLPATSDYLANGVALEKDYGYTGTVGECQANKVQIAAPRVTGHRSINSESDLQSAVAKGPAFIALDAGCPGFQSYKSGVLTKCTKDLNHGVVAVGYGTEGRTPFWHIKNSWGTGWGKDGYIKIYRGNQTAAIGQYCTTMTTN